MNENTRFETAKANPTELYDSAEQVLKDDALTDNEKRMILIAWKSEAVHMQTSEAEGFEGGENSLLDSIESALDSLTQESQRSVLKDLNS